MRRLHEHLIEDRRDEVAILRIEREEALGALSRSLVESIGSYFEALRDDPAVRVLLLTGTGKGFIAGADIGEYHAVSSDEFDSYQRLSRRVFSTLESLPQITIAAVNGYALGGGFEVALCCDLVVAAERARFGLPEIKLGLLPGGGGTQRLARAAGIRFATEAVLTGRFIDADELRASGVVSRVHPAGELMDRAIELAEEIAGRPPMAVAEAKHVLRTGLEGGLEDGLTIEQQALSRLFGTADAAEGINAFLNKREPRFVGR
ncbi:enoyl-CoA hydratase/isomerase family protein [Microlunatus elymi]|uniref:enoyl-CoA hydratase n=1 Tax=Microlunatus elymi TaxID=2596828 RepID=A0A516PVZ9_9ACTN|nr:enoyl-CoA hydratase-related protein [Microlunatus elymi]QDP95366.1 enoyl-CoA hydratase/isomerase family protein [Microlunatus elymi]